MGGTKATARERADSSYHHNNLLIIFPLSYNSLGAEEEREEGSSKAGTNY
jgi:hypothetical protein